MAKNSQKAPTLLKILRIYVEKMLPSMILLALHTKLVLASGHQVANFEMFEDGFFLMSMQFYPIFMF